ncbi:MAG TPA: hypothetical protein VK335_04405 [Bryobacteraceae bacterium]|nr:hypothetical protein [Bryobacteraceae bacterium]
MRAFEIHLNGKKLCVAGMEHGSLLFSIVCSENKKDRGAVGLGMTGLKLNQETVRWRQRTLQLNDEVGIRIVEADAVDKPKVLQPASRDTRKYEKAAVRRLAKEFGWTVQTGKGGKKAR